MPKRELFPIAVFPIPDFSDLSVACPNAEFAFHLLSPRALEPTAVLSDHEIFSFIAHAPIAVL